jgi:hypothetical protein
MRRVQSRRLAWTFLLLSLPPIFAAVEVSASTGAVQAPGRADGGANAGAARYRVNQRPSDKDPWQLYLETRSRSKADTIASEVRASGYQAQVVDDLTPAPQAYPDAADTSASSYYPTSNWAADYNSYIVPGGNYGYGWYGGFNPWYRNRVYPNYWWNGGSAWNSGWWRGHHWNGGWNRGEGWNSSHRHWNRSHADRGSHYAHHEHHSQDAHHMYHPQHASVGHHTSGHHAAARHASNASADHRGTGHRGAGARTAGHRAGGHQAGGHAARGHAGGGRAGGHNNSAGRHAAGQHGRHLDP